MQTFLPYANFKKSAEVLDYKRLGKQRVEASQILDCIAGIGSKRWINHPAVQMWFDYPDALCEYYNTVLDEWMDRGYNNNMPYREPKQPIEMPNWFGFEPFHRTHRSMLVYKNSDYYYPIFKIPPIYGYVWPRRKHASSRP